MTMWTATLTLFLVLYARLLIRIAIAANHVRWRCLVASHRIMNSVTVTMGGG